MMIRLDLKKENLTKNQNSGDLDALETLKKEKNSK